VNVGKSAVARPWQRKFLGYSLTWHREPKLRIAAASVERLTAKVKVLLRGARGRTLGATIQTLNPLLRGWAAYFKLTQTKRSLEERDGWIRHKLRCILWRQWKRAGARARTPVTAGVIPPPTRLGAPDRHAHRTIASLCRRTTRQPK